MLQQGVANRCSPWQGPHLFIDGTLKGVIDTVETACGGIVCAIVQALFSCEAQDAWCVSSAGNEPTYV